MPEGQRGPLSTRGTADRRWRGSFVKSFDNVFMSIRVFSYFPSSPQFYHPRKRAEPALLQLSARF
jgi:hypothetical protein